jgi:HD-like signal output (HDOD) protein
VAVLAAAQRHHPQAARIVLAGHEDEDRVRVAAGLSHQVLNKPCEAAALQDGIARAVALRSLLASERILDMVAHLRPMPGPPVLYLRLLELLQDPRISLRALAEVVSQDEVLSAHVLQAANSPIFGMARVVRDVFDAVLLVGAHPVKAIALTSHAFMELAKGTAALASVDRLWWHALRVAQMSRRLALMEHTSRTIADEAFIAGMLHEVGRLLFASTDAARYRALMRAAREGKVSIDQLELDAYRGTHAEAGAYLLKRWGLSDPVVEAVAYYLKPSACIGKGFGTLSALHAAHHVVSANDRIGDQLPLDLAHMIANRKVERVPVWREAFERLAEDL